MTKKEASSRSIGWYARVDLPTFKLPNPAISAGVMERVIMEIEHLWILISSRGNRFLPTRCDNRSKGKKPSLGGANKFEYKKLGAPSKL